MKKIVILIVVALTYFGTFAQSPPQPAPETPPVPCGFGGPGPGPGPGNGPGTIFQAPGDPNAFNGPVGVGVKHWVAKKDTLNYTIQFENAADIANAAASVVKINYPIDTNQDISTFALGSFGFNNSVFTIPPGTNAYYQRLNLIDSLGIYVDITAGIDVINREAFWYFESVDTATLVLNLSEGFLPVSDSTIPNQGVGTVNFTIKPLSTTHTGDTMSPRAYIIFNSNDTVPTNTYRNTIDAVAPVSSIAPLTTSSTNPVALIVSAADDSGGVGFMYYNLYVSVDGGAFSLYQSQISSLTYSFSGLSGHLYKFYTLAFDSVLNEESVKNTASASTTIINTGPPYFTQNSNSVSLLRDTTCSLSTINTCLGSADPQGASVTYQVVGAPLYGTVNLTPGSNGVCIVYQNTDASAITDSFYVSVCDSLYCDTLQVKTFFTPVSAGINGTASACGPVTLTATGGTSFSWSGGNPANAAIDTFTSSGTYTVTVTNGNCSATASQLVTVNPLPTAIVSGGGTVCTGAALPNVSIALTGTEPWSLTYAINGVDQTPVTGISTSPYIITGASAGTYAVTALSDDNCIGTSFTGSTTVTVNTLPTATVSGGGTICAGATLPNVSITLTGTAPWNLTYSINGVDQTPVTGIGVSPYVITGASAGAYAVTALNDANCTGTSFTGNATVIVNTLPTASVSGGGTVCTGATLPNVSIALTGAEPWNLTYSINGVDQTPVTGISVSPYVITGASAGAYAVTALSDANCTGTSFTGSATVIVNTLPTASVSGGGTVCTGATLPNVSIALTGAEPWNLTYSINGVDQTPVTGISTSPYIITGASAGAYAVTALSDVNCTGTSFTGSASVIVNTLPTASVSGGGTVCPGAALPNVSIALTGTGPWNLTYSINGVDQTPVTGIGASPYVITGAAAGAYVVTALSDANCTGTSFTGSATVIVNTLPTASVSGGGTVCTGATLPNVSIALTGTGPWNLTYSINGVDQTPVTGIGASPYVITGAAAGAYVVTALSDANCTGTSFTGSASVIVNTLPTASVSGGGTVCPGAALPNVSIALTGTGPWNLTYSINGVDQTPVTGISVSPYVITGASPGAYAVTALSDANCTGTSFTGSATVTVNTLPTATVSGGGTICTGATLPNVSIALTGTEPWNLTYSINGVDQTPVTGISVSPYVITGASAGAYAVTALSDANCTGTSFTGSATVIVNTLPTASVSGGGTVCTGAALPNVSIALTGTEPWNLTYSINGVDQTPVTGISVSPYVITGASAGAYAVTALSDANCTGTSFTGSATVIVNTLPTASVSGGGTVCTGATLPNVSITLTGAEPWNLTYSINGVDQTPVTGISTSPYAITGASAGTYAVTALSDANCTGTSFTGGTTLKVNPLPTATVSGGGTQPANVSIALTGTGPWNLTYAINGVNQTQVTGITSSPYIITGAATGTYTATALSDANCTGTTFTGSAIVTANSPLPTATVSGGGTVCTGSTLPNVSITLTGTEPWNLTYAINGVNQTPVAGITASPYIITRATAGTYTVTALHDANNAGTSFTGSATVKVNPLPTASASGGGTVCTGSAPPNVNIALTGAEPWNLTYSINGVDQTPVTGISTSPYIITGAAAGTYVVTALSDANCAGTSFTGSATVIINTLPTASVSGGGTVCTGATLPNVSIALTGTGPWNLTYSINGVNQTPVTGITTSPYIITDASAGTYAVTALSDANCTGTSFSGAATVKVNPLPTATVSGGGTQPANVSIALTGSGPWNLTYAINGVNQTQVTGITTSPYVITGAATGTYTAAALTDVNCTGTSLIGSAIVTASSPLPTATVSGGGTVCAGSTLPNVSIALTGTKPWNLTYAINGVNQTPVTGITASPYVITRAAAGIYTVTALHDANNAGTSFTGSATVKVNPLPTASPGGGGTVCTGAALPNVSIALTGTEPWNLTYSINGVNHVPVTGISTSPYVITGAAAGTYAVTALSDANCTGTSFTGSATVKVNPLPTASVSGGGTACTGATPPNVSIALTGTKPWNLTYSVNGVNQTPVTGITASPYLISGSSAGIYAVTALNDANCTGSSFTGSASVTVNTKPTATISSGGFTSFCSSVALSATPVTGATYQWRRNNANISAATTTSYTATTADTYTCVLTNACGSNTSNSIVLTKVSAPAATITGPTSACLSVSNTGYSGTVALTANTGTGYTYQWEAGGAAIAGATGQNYSTAYTTNANANVTVTYNLIVTNTAASGCSNTSGNHNVTYHAVPAITINGGNGDTIIRCSGIAAVLTASTGFTYQWYEFSGSTLVPLNVTTRAYTESPVPVTNVTYQVAGTTTAGCVAYATIKVNEGVTPGTGITLSGSASFCTSVTMSVVNNAAFTYQWKKGSTDIAGATTNNYTATASGNYTCTIASSTCTATTTAEALTKLSVPAASFTGLATLCPGQSTTLTANNGTGFSWQWLLNGSQLTGATSRTYGTPTTLPSPAFYSVRVTNSSECSTASTADTITQSLPTATTTITSGSLALCKGQSVTLEANTSTDYTWQWKANGTNITGAVGKAESYTASTAGSYTVVVTKNALCSTTSLADVVSVSTCTQAELVDDSIGFSYDGYLKVYPNPTENNATLEFDVEEAGPYLIEMYNTLGQMIVYKNVTADKGVNKNYLEINNISSGVYFINLIDEQKNVRSVKLVKE